MPTLATCKVDSSPALHVRRCYFKLFLRGIMLMKNAESSQKINVLECHHIHVILFVSTLIVGPPLHLFLGTNVSTIGGSSVKESSSRVMRATDP